MALPEDLTPHQPEETSLHIEHITTEQLLRTKLDTFVARPSESAEPTVGVTVYQSWKGTDIVAYSPVPTGDEEPRDYDARFEMSIPGSHPDDKQVEHVAFCAAASIMSVLNIPVGDQYRERS